MPSVITKFKQQLNFRDHHIHTLPILMLMPHSRCNCRCVMCDIWKANKNKQELSESDIRKHLGSFRKLGVRQVVLSGGEALMHSNLWKLCRLLKELPARITLISTGLLLERYRADILTLCDEVIVSMDGSRKIHDRIRNIPNAFDRLAQGVTALKEAERTFPVSGRSVLQKLNFRDLPNIIEAAKSLRLDRISFLAADVTSGAFNRAQPWTEEKTAEIALTEEEVREFRELIETVIAARRADFAGGFIAESPGKIRDIGRYYGAIAGLNDFPSHDCNAPYVSAVLEADGAVRPCFFHAPLGNIFQNGFDGVLNSASAVQFRQKLDVKTDAICRRCTCFLNLRVNPLDKFWRK